MTTKSTVAQMLLAEMCREQRGDDTGDDVFTGDDVPDSLNGDTRFQFGVKRRADGAREEFSEYLSEDDDRRLTAVTFAEGTPGEVVKELERRSEGT